MYTNLNHYQMENCPALLGRNLIPPCNRRVKSVPAGWVEISSRLAGTCNHSPSIETHLAVMSGLPTKKFLLECVNEKSSTERRSYSRQTNRSSPECQVLIHYLIRQD